MEKTTNNIKLTLTEKPMSTKKSTYNKHGGGESKTSCKKKEIKICSVCCEDFTKSVRAEIICPSCEFSACKVCVRIYLLDTTSVAHCMSCKNSWDREFTQTSINKSFYNKEYKKHREQILFESEKARFPDTMPAVKAHIESKDLTVEVEQLKIKRNAIREQLYVIENSIYKTNNKIQRLRNGETKTEALKFIKKCPADNCEGFLSSAWKCGVCKLWVCNKCEQEKGFEKDAEHTCDPNILASAQLIKKETKGCPKCAVPIFKIDGCDQMWCTACQVAFSWRTGRIVNGTIHNPHYYEFQRTNGNVIRNPGAVICGGLPTYLTVRDRCRRFESLSRKFTNEEIYELVLYISMHDEAALLTSQNYFPPRNYNQLPDNLRRNGLKWLEMAKTLTNNSYNSSLATNLNRDFINKLFYNSIYNTHRQANHFQHTILNTQREWCQRNRNNEDLRIRFLTNGITENEMKSKLISRDKMTQKRTAALNVYEVFGTVITESVVDMYNILTTFVQNIGFNDRPTLKNTMSLIDNFINNFTRINRVRLYCNTELIKISKIYNQTVQVLTPQLNTESYKYKKGNENLVNTLTA